MNKRATYTIAGVLIAILIVVVVYTKFFAPNYSYLAKYDNVNVSGNYMSSLYSIANNETLANKIGESIGPNSGYRSISNGTPLVAGGKPAVMYYGAEFCPYCAVTRWSIIIAMMRFGNFSGLRYMTSAASDILNYTPTFTFYNSTYTSNYISFISVEFATNLVNPNTGTYYQLQVPNELENATVSKYGSGGIPFIDFGNKSVQNGAVVNPTLIRGSNWTTVLSNMENPNSPVSQNLIGGANLFTAQICEMTGNAPANVCGQAYVKAIERYD